MYSQGHPLFNGNAKTRTKLNPSLSSLFAFLPSFLSSYSFIRSSFFSFPPSFSNTWACTLSQLSPSKLVPGAKPWLRLPPCPQAVWGICKGLLQCCQDRGVGAQVLWRLGGCTTRSGGSQRKFPWRNTSKLTPKGWRGSYTGPEKNVQVISPAAREGTMESMNWLEFCVSSGGQGECWEETEVNSPER